MPLTTRSSRLTDGVAARAGVEGVAPERSVHAAAQVWADRSKVVLHISPVGPTTTTYSVVPRTAQTGCIDVTPLGFRSHVAAKVLPENVLWYMPLSVPRITSSVVVPPDAQSDGGEGVWPLRACDVPPHPPAKVL